MAAFVGALSPERQGMMRETDAKEESILLHRTTPTAGLRRIRIVIFANRTPYRWNLHTGSRNQYEHKEKWKWKENGCRKVEGLTR
jgi:hypothetical protein